MGLQALIFILAKGSGSVVACGGSAQCGGAWWRWCNSSSPQQEAAAAGSQVAGAAAFGPRADLLRRTVSYLGACARGIAAFPRRWDMNRDRAAAAKAAVLEGNPMLVDSGRPSASATQQGSSCFLPSGQLPGDDLVLGHGKRPCLSS